MATAKTLFLIIVFVSACANQIPDPSNAGPTDETQEVTVELGASHKMTFAAQPDGYQTIVETSGRNETPILERFGSQSAAAIYAAIAPRNDVPQFLRDGNDASSHDNVVAATQALSGGDFVDLRGACQPGTCLRFSDPDYVVLSHVCLLGQQGGTYSDGRASTAYALFNARSRPGVAQMTFPNGKEVTTQMNPDDRIGARAIGPRGKLGVVSFSIFGEDGPDAVYDLDACYTGLPQ